MSRAVKKLNTFFLLSLKKTLSTDDAAAAVIKEFRSHVQHGVMFHGKTEKEEPTRRSRVVREAIVVTASETEHGGSRKVSQEELVMQLSCNSYITGISL